MSPLRKQIEDFVNSDLFHFIELEYSEQVVEAIERFVGRCLTEQEKGSILENEKQDEKTTRP